MNIALAVGSNFVCSKAPKKPARAAVRVVNGRVIGPTLHDPEVKREVADAMEVLRQDIEALRDSYVKQGVITKGGKLTKRFGG